MEVSCVVYPSVPCFSPAGVDSNSHYAPSIASFCTDAGAFRLSVGRGSKTGLRFGTSESSDNGHKQYYSRSMSVSCGGEKMKEMDTTAKYVKKRLKLVKNLSKDLSMFSQVDFGFDPDNGLVNQAKGKMISEATDLLLAQLKQLTMEEKELKRRRKEEKAKLKAARMENRLACESSSSSHSESGDSECGEVVDMSHLKKGALSQTLPIGSQTVIQEPTSALSGGNVIESQPQGAVSTLPSMIQEQNMTVQNAPQVLGLLQQEHSTKSSISDSNLLGSVNCRIESSSTSEKKIVVCMGGKCKKSGGAVLLEEFQKAVGVEGATGCKCMGKCRDGPNVRVLNSSVGIEDNDRTSTNSLCAGVNLEDVGLIVSNFFRGENQKNLGLAGAS